MYLSRPSQPSLLPPLSPTPLRYTRLLLPSHHLGPQSSRRRAPTFLALSRLPFNIVFSRMGFTEREGRGVRAWPPFSVLFTFAFPSPRRNLFYTSCPRKCTVLWFNSHFSYVFGYYTASHFLYILDVTKGKVRFNFIPSIFGQEWLSVDFEE